MVARLLPVIILATTALGKANYDVDLDSLISQLAEEIINNYYCSILSRCTQCMLLNSLFVVLIA